MPHSLKDFSPCSFVKGEDGTITPFAIIMVLIFIAIGGLAVDFNKAVSERTQLQTAADTAAHAALYTVEFKSHDEARTEALSVIQDMLPASAYQDAILTGDIEFGYIDEITGEFVIDQNSREAVRTFARLETLRGNPSRNFLLFVIGFDTFDIGVSSVYATYFPPCLNEGYIANGIIDLQSGNSYRDEFCIHSNTHVEINQGNYLESGVTVSMPSMNDFVMPSSGYDQNDGLQESLRQSGYRMRLLDQMDRRFQSLRNGSPTYAAQANVTVLNDLVWPLDIKGDDTGNKGQDKKAATTASRFTATDANNKSVEPASFDQTGRIYQLECNSGRKVTFKTGTYSDFALVTNCDIDFSNGVILTDVIIATEGDVVATQTQMGVPDSCTKGGGAQLWIGGDFKSSSNFTSYGAQIIAQGDVQFPAQSSGMEGLSVFAGGRIDATSNAIMRSCGDSEIEDFQYAKYFRMVQ